MPAPKTSPRPKPRPYKDVSPTAEKDDQLLVKTKKYANGGVVRGAGAATKGKRYSRCG